MSLSTLNALDARKVIDNGMLSSDPDSPSFNLQSAQSPSCNPLATGINISLQFTERESDSRHEPFSMDIDKHFSATPTSAIKSPQELEKSFSDEDIKFTEESNLVDPPKTVNTVVNDMATDHTSGVIGSTECGSLNIDLNSPQMEQSQFSSQSIGIYDTSLDTGDRPPPAKRARKLLVAEQTSLAHSPSAISNTDSKSTNSPINDRPGTLTAVDEHQISVLSQQQHRFCISTIRHLKKLKDASPFLVPVDPIALNIPHYPSIIKHPMDLSTIERKLVSSNPTRPDPNNPRYLNADEFVADVRLIFSNALAFNGPDHIVSQMGKRVEAMFDKSIRQMPLPAEEPKLSLFKKAATPSASKTPSPVPVNELARKMSRRTSTSVPTIRRSETENARPKREIHPPPPKDLPYADIPKKVRRTSKGKLSETSVEQLKFCGKILSDLHKKQYWSIANPFYDPVDWVKLDLPSYPKLIKKPIDMGTMRKKLEAKEYSNAAKFQEDFKLMIKNCKTFNPTGTPVYNAGVELERIFSEKWAALPLTREVSDNEDEDEDESDDEHARTIAMMESQIESIRGTVAALKNKKAKKEKERKRDKYASPPRTASTKVNSKHGRPFTGRKKGKSLKEIDDILSFEQKKDLSITIQKLDGEKLEKVISIIHEGVPEIRDSTEEIELDIDSLPAKVLTKLYNFVLRPLRNDAPKRSRSGTGTGGLKRKSMDEDVEAEKIRQLEERMRLFEGAVVSAPSGSRDNDSIHSSDDSSSVSSGSDSEC